jgi:hypothetical protein
MSRPKPKVVLEYTNNSSFVVEQILTSDAIWAVFYKNNPFNLKSSSLITNSGPKYKKTAFIHPGHAFSLAKKLNTMFKTVDFTVVKLTHGEPVE